MTDDFIAELRSGRDWLNDGRCCGQVDSLGACCAPACIFGEALKYFYKAADMLEARGKRIGELESRLLDKEAHIAELEAALKEMLDHIDDPYNDLAIQIGELLEGKSDV